MKMSTEHYKTTMLQLKAKTNCMNHEMRLLNEEINALENKVPYQSSSLKIVSENLMKMLQHWHYATHKQFHWFVSVKESSISWICLFRQADLFLGTVIYLGCQST